MYSIYQLLLLVFIVCSIDAMPTEKDGILTKEANDEHDIVRTISSCKRHPTLSSITTESWKAFLVSYKNLLSKFQFPGEHKVILTYVFNPKTTNLRVGGEGNQKEFNLSITAEPSGCLQIFDEEEIITTNPLVPVQ